MPPFRERPLLLVGFPLLLSLGGCDARSPEAKSTECDTIETRGAVLKQVSENRDNPLVAYAAKNADKDDAGRPRSEADKSAAPEQAKPLYQLGQKLVTTSVSADKRTLQCSGAISASVGDLKATKEINFTVQKSSDGQISVSVTPFKF